MDAFMATKMHGGSYSVSKNPKNGSMGVTVKFPNGYSVVKEFNKGNDIIAMDVLDNAGNHVSFMDSVVREPESPYQRPYSKILGVVSELPLQLEMQQ